MRQITIAICLTMLLSGCGSPAYQSKAKSALRELDQVMAAIHQQESNSYITALTRLRPAVADVLKELESNPELMSPLRDPFLRLDTASQRVPLEWDALFREATLVKRALNDLANRSGQG